MASKNFTIVTVVNLVLIGMILDQVFVMFGFTKTIIFDSNNTMLIGLIWISVVGCLFVIGMSMKNLEWKRGLQNNDKVSRD